MKVDDRHLAERSGVSEVQRRVTTQLKWLFREQPISDFGIDAEIEVVKEGHATGRLLAAQIKSGPSYFAEPADDGYVYRGDTEHLEYWLNHSLPVIVIICNPQTGDCLWQNVTEKVIERTPKGWKIAIPKAQSLEPSSTDALDRVAGALWCKLTAEEAKYLATRIESFDANERLHFLGASVFGLTPTLVSQFTASEQEQFIQNIMAGVLKCVELVNVVVLRRCKALVSSYQGKEGGTFRLALGRLFSMRVLCGIRCLTFPRPMCDLHMKFLASPVEEQVHSVAVEFWDMIAKASVDNSLRTQYASFDSILNELLASFAREREVVSSMIRELDEMMPNQLLVAVEPLRSVEDIGVMRRFAASAEAIKRATEAGKITDMGGPK